MRLAAIGLNGLAMVALIPASVSAQVAVPASAPRGGDKVYAGDIITRWGKMVTPENAWRGYPRPQMKRKAWLNLNGKWDYAITPLAAPRPNRMDGKILVPFAVESRLSGVQRRVTASDRLWYRRDFTLPAAWAGQNVLLHFGAVDFETDVLVNGVQVGSHRGGSDAFSFDITPYLRAGANELVVRVADPTTDGSQPRGKQTLDPRGIWYTAVSGIWQTVWLEPVPKLHIKEVRATPDIDTGAVAVDVLLSGGSGVTDAVKVTARAGDKVVGTTLIRGNRRGFIAIPNARLWSPGDPFLYDLTAELVKVENPLGAGPNNAPMYQQGQTQREAEAFARATVTGAPGDTVDAYFAMRKISVGTGPIGNRLALHLNNKPLFHNGTLDQGWWPESLLTPPSEEAMVYDMAFLQKAGFNMLRKHIKVEPAQYYAAADRMGMLIWQDMPSGGFRDQGVGRLSDRQATLSSDDMAQFQDELVRMIGDLRAFPSIVMWVVNNEGWGQYDAATLSRFVKGTDPSRLVNAVSGWQDVGDGSSDVYDIHTYEETPRSPEWRPGRASVIGEFGGVSYSVAGHLWFPDRVDRLYQAAKTPEDYLARYKRKMDEVVRQKRAEGLAASIYTETTDVEGELNGLLTYDREVIKIPAATLAEIAAPLTKE